MHAVVASARRRRTPACTGLHEGKNKGHILGTIVHTRFLPPEERARWVTFVAESPDGGVHALPAYLEALCNVTGSSFRILCAERDGGIVGGIALFEQGSRLGKFVSPRLLLRYNGILLAHESGSPAQRTASQLHTLMALEEALAKLPYPRMQFRCRSTLTDLRVFAERGWTLQPGWTYVVELGDMAAAWSRMHKDQRRLVQRCGENGLQVTVDGDFEAFHDLHVQTHRRKGAPLYLPRDSFRDFVETLQRQGLARLFHARLPSGQIVASQLVLTGPHPVTHTIAAATDARALKSGVSAFLRWKVFEFLADAGYRANDLTGAGLDPVTRFKSQLGGELALCLRVSRSDRFAFRAGEFALDLVRRTKSSLARARTGTDEHPHE
ncbi:MAG: GNAT family N-acetyltransferase [Rhodanobacteraceae bacterium]